MLYNLQVDFMRMLTNRRFYYSIAGMIGTLILSGMAYFSNSGNVADLDNCFVVVSSSGYILLFYILCIVGGGIDYCTECKYHYMRYAVQRNGINAYARSKTIVAAVSGCSSMLISLAGYEGLMFLFLFFQRGSAEGIFASREMFIANVWNAVIFSLLGAVLSSMALLVTTFVENVFVGIASPILIYYVIITFSNKYGTVFTLMPSCVYFGDYELLGSRQMQFLYALFYTACILWIFYRVINYRMRRRLENG